MSEIKAKPTPGYRYQVVAGDRLTFISRDAYGSEKYAQNIVDANPFLQGRPISLEGLPTIYADILTIPYLPQTRKIIENLPDKSPNNFTLTLEGREIPVTAGRLLLTMDRPSDGWTASIPWRPGDDTELDKILLPFKYPEAMVYLGGKLRNTGRLYTVGASLNGSNSSKELAGFSQTIDLVDSNVIPPYERNNITLNQLANIYTKGSGIQAIFKADSGGPFDRLTASKSDKKIDHLTKISSERGLIVTNDYKGNLVFTQAITSGKSVGTLEEGKLSVTSWAASYDGRKLFHSYKATGESPGGDAQTATANDENVPIARNTTFEANDTTPGDILKAAEWQRSRVYAEALELSIPVAGWYAPNGELWEPNTFVTIVSPTLDLPDGVTLLIQSVEFNFSTQGVSANLKLIPPQVFTMEQVPYLWRIV